jgi:hypothetical protein
MFGLKSLAPCSLRFKLRLCIGFHERSSKVLKNGTKHFPAWKKNDGTMSTEYYFRTASIIQALVSLCRSSMLYFDSINVLTASLDYDDSDQRYQDDTPRSPSSREFAAFEQYSQDNLLSRVHDAVEALLDKHVIPIEESIKRLLPEVVRSCQAKMFKDWAQLKSGSSSETAQMAMSENPEREQGSTKETTVSHH